MSKQNKDTLRLSLHVFVYKGHFTFHFLTFTFCFFYFLQFCLFFQNGGDSVTSNRRICKRKNSGRIRQDSSNKNQQNKPSDLEVRSATKIQAGVRGFLVRKRQKNANKPVAEASQDYPKLVVKKTCKFISKRKKTVRFQRATLFAQNSDFSIAI